MTVTRRELESLVGKLSFVSNCVKSSRVFLSRLLNWMRTIERGKIYCMNEQAIKDIRWRHGFLPKFNGTALMSLIKYPTTDFIMVTEACLTGLGGICGNRFFKFHIPTHLRDPNIAHLEFSAIIVGVKLWALELEGKYFIIHICHD